MWFFFKAFSLDGAYSLEGEIFYSMQDFILPEHKAQEILEKFQEYFEDISDAKVAALICVKLLRDHNHTETLRAYWNNVHLHLRQL